GGPDRRRGAPAAGRAGAGPAPHPGRRPPPPQGPPTRQGKSPLHAQDRRGSSIDDRASGAIRRRHELAALDGHDVHAARLKAHDSHQRPSASRLEAAVARDRRARGGKVATLALLAFAMLTTSLDQYNVVVALPSIGRGLDFSAQTLQWVISAYAGTSAGFLLVGGRAADLLGRRRVLWLG